MCDEQTKELQRRNAERLIYLSIYIYTINKNKVLFEHWSKFSLHTFQAKGRGGSGGGCLGDVVPLLARGPLKAGIAYNITTHNL